jgi:hypothetical protein
MVYQRVFIKVWELVTIEVEFVDVSDDEIVVP